MPDPKLDLRPVNPSSTADNPSAASSRASSGGASGVWMPPVIAGLLLLLVLATFLWPGGAGHGSQGNDSSTSGDTDTLGSGASINRSSAKHTDDPRDTDDLQLADDSLLETTTQAPPSTTPNQPAPDSSFSEVQITESAAGPAASPSQAPATANTTPLPAPPRLGFQTDLSAPAQPTPPPVERFAPSVGLSQANGPERSGAASFFGQTGRGSRFVYIIDRSGSMRGGRFDAARFELIKSIRSLQEHESFFIIFYSSDATPMPASSLLPATPDNQQRQIDWARSVSIGGGTDPTEALELALGELKPDTIWLLSDGRFNVAVADTVRRLNPGADVQINTIAFHDPSGEAILKIIADENDGDYRFVAP